nr:ribosome biogenesis protein BMS1/TSR1, AARP2CN [Tanacetum cinerariifolium]
MKTSEDVSEEDLKGMMQLVPVEEARRHTLVYQLQEIRKRSYGELKRLSEHDFEDQLWTHNQNLMHDPLDWILYDTCGVHHVFTKDQEIFMLVERDYPLRRGLAIVMICNKLQVSFRITFGVNLSNKVSLIVTLSLLRVTITLSFKEVDPTLGNSKYGSDSSMVVDEGKQDFTNPTDRQKFGLEDDQTSLKLKDSNDKTNAEAL